jgi:hypothetical protein
MSVGTDADVQSERHEDMRNSMISAPLRALAAAVLWVSISAPVLAQATKAGQRDATHPLSVPIPPVRPNRPAPAVPAPPKPTPVEVPPSWPSINHVELRARIHDCAVKWRNMKANGADIGTTWTDFSSGCLAVK